MSNSTVAEAAGTQLTADQILSIAQADATSAYPDLSTFNIRLSLEEDGWHVDYDLKNPRWKGGGPHYVVHAVSGLILSKRYDQ